MHNDIDHILISEEEIQSKIKEIGQQISKDYADKKLLLISVLKGSVVVMADLMRAIDIPLKVDFMSVSSYGSGVKTSGTVRILKDLDMDIADYDVLIVEDILDSGMTLRYLKDVLAQRHPSSMKVFTLLDKPERRQVEVDVDYVGFQIPDEFVVGYGLDYDQYYRQLPYVGVMKPEVYKD